MIKFKNNIIGSRRVTITSALPYVTGVKHLGNLAGSILPADIFHRFLDLLGIPNIYICGTDDYGTATEIAAKQEGLKPKAYCDKYYKVQKDIYKQWNFDFSFFGQTSTPKHTKLVQSVIEDMNKKGFVIKDVLKLPYCSDCKKYLADRYVGGECPACGYDGARGDQCEKCSKVLDPADLENPYCNICKSKKIIFKEEKHLFLDLQSLQPKLKKWIETKKWPDNTKNIALGWIKEGLKPRCITRNLEWGIPVPIKGYEHLVIYVWLDAPWGYVSITQNLKEWEKWWTDSKIVHFLGKDNIPFHTIFFPATIMASGNIISLPHFVAGYEYLNWEGKKFSTSKGVGLFSDDALKLYPADYWRFYLARTLPETKDSNFDWDDFQNRINNELIANYGNLFYRVTSFIEKNFSSVPKPGKMDDKDRKLQSDIQKKVKDIEQLIDSVKLREALQKIMALSAGVNKYFQDKKPWASKEEAGTCLYVSVNALRTITTLLWPYIPETAEKALQALGVRRTNWPDITDFIIKPGHKVQAWMPFRKIEEGEIRRKKTVEEVTEAMKKCPDLRIATITQVEDHPNADKLFVLSADLGSFGERTIVAGLKGYYKKEELKGKQIVVVTNMEPKELKGVVSQGMLLACDNGVLVSPEKKLKNGSVLMECKEQISFNEFMKNELVIKDGAVYCNDKLLHINGITIKPVSHVAEGMKVR